MKLDYDLMREALLILERDLTISDDLAHNGVSLFQLCKKPGMAGCNMADVYYALHNLQQAGLIEAAGRSADDRVDSYLVFDITYEGHEFLASIRPKGAWERVKAILAKVGTMSIPLIAQAASKVISGYIGREA